MYIKRRLNAFLVEAVVLQSNCTLYLIFMYVYYNCVMMEAVGDVTAARTKRFNVMYVYKCVRQPGFVYEFFHRKKQQLYLQGLL